MRALVAYYSRNGNTRKVAKEISELLDCDIENIIDTKNRDGFFNWFICGRDAIKKKETIIEKNQHNPSKYDLVILGTPVWAGNMAPALRTYIKKNKTKLKNVAFFCTCGGSSCDNMFDELCLISNKKPLANLTVKQNEIKQELFLEKVKEFCDKLKRPKKETKKAKKKK